MPDDTDVNIEHNKRQLEKIRSENNGGRNERPGVSDRYAQSGDRNTRQDAGSSNGPVERTTGRTPGAREDNQPPQGLREGVRQADRQSINTSKGPDRSDRRGQTNEDVKPSSFTLKNPFGKLQRGPVKLFSKEEAEESYDRLYEVYFRGADILDDILEIVVRDHEKVTIWHLQPDEAEQLATMHLERARHDVEAARSARQLLALYDRIYLYVLAAPRVQGTIRHVKEHKGFSFR